MTEEQHFYELEAPYKPNWKQWLNEPLNSISQTIYDNVVFQLKKFALIEQVDLYTLSSEFIMLEKNDKQFSEVLDFIQKTKIGSNIIASEIDDQPSNWTFEIEGGVAYFCLNNKVKDNNYFQLCLTTTSEETKNKFKNFFIDFKDRHEYKDGGSSELFFLIQTRGQFQFRKIPNKNNSLIEKNYNKQVCEDYVYIKEELSKKDLSGRLVVFEGPPGTGKTNLVKSITKDISGCRFVIIPAQYVGALSSPEMMSSLLDFADDTDEVWDELSGNYIETEAVSRIIFLVEDADNVLQKRDMTNNEIISTLLNFADGIMGQSLDIAFICTTNVLFDYDEAVLRNGRLLKKTSVEYLSPSEATECYKNLTGKDFEFKEKVPLSDVYAKVSGKEVEVKKEKKVGFR